LQGDSSVLELPRNQRNAPALSAEDRGKVLRFHPFARQRHQPSHFVLELPDISRPRVADQPFLGRLSKLDGPSTFLQSVFLKEMKRKGQDVLGPIAQGRDFQDDAFQAEIEV